MPELSSPPKVQIIPPGMRRWDGSTVLIAHDCALLERFTGKSYSYRTVNLKTGESAHIFSKKEPLRESEYMAVIERALTIRAPVAAPAPDFRVDVRLGESVSRERLAEVLSHIFGELLPEHGYSYRADQAGLAAHILEALCRRLVSLSEAGVGIGKTHAYLIAAALVKRGRFLDSWLKYPGMTFIDEMPVVVATSSIALQKAIVQGYIPKISRILLEHGIIAKPLTCVIRKGKEHYLCERRLRLLWLDSKSAGIKQLLEPLFRKKGAIDLDEMDSLDPYIKRKIKVTGGCGRSCSLRKSCRYMAFLNNAQSDKHDFQICNHNYLLADVVRRAKGQEPLIPRHQAVIIDEAHKFIQAARQMYGTELSNRTIPPIAKMVRSFAFEEGQSTYNLWRYADKLDSYAKNLFRVLVDNVPDSCTDDEAERFKTVINGRAGQYLRKIGETLGLLAAELEERQVLRIYAGQYAYIMRELASLREQIAAFENHDELIYWLEAPEGLGSLTGGSDEIFLRAIPKRLGEMLHADLWGKGVPVVLTSGTLSASGDFTHIKQGFGLDRLKPGKLVETSKPSPYDYRENALLYISESVPFPDSRDARYIAAVADETERLIMAAHGHTAVLFTSYRVMELVFDTLKTRGLSQSGGIPFPLFKMGRGGTNTIERFRESGNGVLFAAGSMWEGIDLPGDILSMLIIVKLPFSVPDPISEHERTRYGSAEQYKNAVIIPEMLVKLMQGFGRLIRSEWDTGVVAILDFRVREGGAYRSRVLRALPGCRVTSCIEVVKAFLKLKKPPKYFRNIRRNFYAVASCK